MSKVKTNFIIKSDIVKIRGNTYITCNADEKYNTNTEKKDKVNLFTQFFISDDKERFNENLFCLHKNIKNHVIDRIFLLNERIYTAKEMRLKKIPSKVIQINMRKRLMFSDVFKAIRRFRIKGYLILSNLDIFFNETLKNIYLTSIKEKRIVYSQLRYEYDNPLKRLKSCSQDTWIYHSGHPVRNINSFNYYFGQPGCDTRTNYLLWEQGFKCHNHPSVINCIHVHKDKKRNYKLKHIKKKLLQVFPVYRIGDRENHEQSSP